MLARSVEPEGQPISQLKRAPHPAYTWISNLQKQQQVCIAARAALRSFLCVRNRHPTHSLSLPIFLQVEEAARETKREKQREAMMQKEEAREIFRAQVYALNKLHRVREEAAFAEFKWKMDAKRQQESASPGSEPSDEATGDDGASAPAAPPPPIASPSPAEVAKVTTRALSKNLDVETGSVAVARTGCEGERSGKSWSRNGSRQWDPNAAKAAALLGGA